MTLPSQSLGGFGPDWLIGQVIEGYRVESMLGAGGMGVVYVVRHTELGSLAALKTLLPTRKESRSEESRARFINEARALGRVANEGLVRIFNFGHLSDGTPYFIMELLSGQTLRQRISNSVACRLRTEEALAITEQAASTLAILHSHGVIHRDIKPENIMLVPDNFAPGGHRVKLLDFGIAKLVEPMASTLTQEPLGTPLYMSPEGCRNEVVTPQADVYSLGCVLYEMLCGRTPYVSDNSNLLLQHIFNTPEPPRSHTSDIPFAVQSLTLQLLAREPQARPTMTALASFAQRLRLHPERLLRWRIYWTVLRAWHTKLGRVFAWGLGMPVLLLSVALLFVLLTGTAPKWLDALLPRSWRSGLVRIPRGHFTMGSTDEELTIARGMLKWYSERAPAPAQQLYATDYMDPAKNFFAREHPTAEIDVGAFEIERHEVTNKDFAEFLNAQKKDKRIEVRARCPSPGKPGQFLSDSSCVYLADQNIPYKNLFDSPIYGGIKYSEGQFIVDPAFRNRPVVAMTWQAANDYCHWRYGKRGRLPTEIEWEYVARRGGRRFPWGNEQPGCNHAAVERCGVTNRGYCQCEPKAGQPVLPDVGSTPLDSSYDGVMDMGGSVSEWTFDWFHQDLPIGPAEARRELGRIEGQNSTEKDRRAVRGGAWTQDFLTTRAAARFRSDSNRTSNDLGLRCVREASR